MSESEWTKAKINRYIRAGKLPRYVFAKGKNMKLERYPDRVWKTSVDPVSGKTIEYKRRGKLTWRMVPVESILL